MNGNDLPDVVYEDNLKLALPAELNYSFIARFDNDPILSFFKEVLLFLFSGLFFVFVLLL